MNDISQLLADLSAAGVEIVVADAKLLARAADGTIPPDLREIKLARLPRMADFAIWATACEPALGLADGAFLAAYNGNREDANSLALESSPIAKVLVGMMADFDEWEGTSTDLLTKLSTRAGIDDKKRAPKGWPANGRMGGKKHPISYPSTKSIVDASSCRSWT